MTSATLGDEALGLLGLRRIDEEFVVRGLQGLHRSEVTLAAGQRMAQETEQGAPEGAEDDGDDQCARPARVPWAAGNPAVPS